MFLSHGDSDPIVPVDMSREFVQELQRIGHNYEYHEIKGGTHSFSQSAPKRAKAVFKAYLSFIDKWTQLGKPQP
jgi:dipeptidyl aminopeptidase/acylaminoacyl peptidase